MKTKIRALTISAVLPGGVSITVAGKPRKVRKAFRRAVEAALEMAPQKTAEGVPDARCL